MNQRTERGEPEMSEFDERIDRRSTADVKWNPEGIKHFLRIESDENTLPMWIADMDFRSAPCVVKALQEKAAFGVYGYVGPTTPYYEAVQWWQKERNGWDVDKSWILSMAGVMPAINCAIRCLTEEGDGVIVQTPVYMNFAETVQATGRRVVENPLVFQDGTYHMDYDGLRRVAAAPDIKALILCNPHNPVGRVWTMEELKELCRICEENNVHIISDEIHSDIIYKGHKHIAFGTVPCEAARKAIVCTSPSKTFNVQGIKCANIIIEDPQLRERFCAQCRALAMHDMDNTFGEAMLRAAYTPEGEAWLESLLEYLEENVRTAEDFLAKNLPQVRLVHPESSYLTWLDFHGTNLTEDELYPILTKKAKVIMNRGSRFGTGGENFFRFNIGAPRAVVLQALEQIAAALQENR